MLASALFLLASVTPAVPTGKLPWFEFHDYPMKAFEKHWEGVTRFDLLVDPQGRVAGCTITQSSGHEELDTTTCSLASFRARFSPARSAQGQPIYGIYRSQAVWVIPEDTLADTAPGPDLEININKLPEGTIDPPAVKLAYSVDAQGRISACAPLSGGPQQPKVLVDLACSELQSHFSAQPVKRANGEAVQAVKTAAVEFAAADTSRH